MYDCSRHVIKVDGKSRIFNPRDYSSHLFFLSVFSQHANFGEVRRHVSDCETVRARHVTSKHFRRSTVSRKSIEGTQFRDSFLHTVREIYSQVYGISRQLNVSPEVPGLVREKRRKFPRLLRDKCHNEQMHQVLYVTKDILFDRKKNSYQKCKESQRKYNASSSLVFVSFLINICEYSSLPFW